MKLTENQKQALRVLQEHPTAIVMVNGWLTGGHGIKLNLSTINSLRKKGLVEYPNRISEAGKAVKL